MLHYQKLPIVMILIVFRVAGSVSRAYSVLGHKTVGLPPAVMRKPARRQRTGPIENARIRAGVPDCATVLP